METGGDLGEFWRLEPWETSLIIAGRRRQTIRLAWHVAALSRAAEGGKLRDLSHYLSDRDRPIAHSQDDAMAAWDAFAQKHNASVEAGE